MHFTLRVDVDYVPWDTPDAKEFGHGEPAMILRVLEAARQGRLRPHFFVSNRVLKAFPSAIQAITADRWPIDWLCKHPEAWEERFTEAMALFERYGLASEGLAIRGTWPEDVKPVLNPPFRFLSAKPGPSPRGVKLFPVESGADREASRVAGAKAWADKTRSLLRENASRSQGLTLCVRPQVLARFDPQLQVVRELSDFAEAIGLSALTLRELPTS